MAKETASIEDYREALGEALEEFEGCMAGIVAEKDALREVIDREKWEYEHQGKPVVPESDLFNPEAIAACTVTEIEPEDFHRSRRAKLAALSRHIGEDASIRSEVRPILAKIAEAGRPVEASLALEVRRARNEYNAAAANLALAESELERFKRETNGRILDAYKRAVCSGDEYGFNEYRRHGLSQPQSSKMVGFIHTAYPVKEVCDLVMKDMDTEAAARARREAVPDMPGPMPVDVNTFGNSSDSGPWNGSGGGSWMLWK